MYSNTTHVTDKNGKSKSDGKRRRIGDLAREAGVSRETVHFYLREGLLPPPEKINARVAYFDEGHLARLRLIKRLQQVHLPLSAIKEHLQYVEGRPAEFLNEHFLPRLMEYLNLDGDEVELTVDEVAGQAGLTLEQVGRLEALGVLQPTLVDGLPSYTEADRNAAAAAKTLLDQGVELEDLRFVQRYTNLIEQENGFILHHIILPSMAAGWRDQVSAGRGFQALRTIEAYLRQQINRRHGFANSAIGTIPDPLEDQETPPAHHK